MKKSSFISLLDCNSLSFHLFFCLHVALCFSQFYHRICFKLCSILKSTAAFCTAVCSKKHFICYTQIFICTEINSFVLKSLSLSVFMIFFPSSSLSPHLFSILLFLFLLPRILIHFLLHHHMFSVHLSQKLSIIRHIQYQ